MTQEKNKKEKKKEKQKQKNEKEKKEGKKRKRKRKETEQAEAKDNEKEKENATLVDQLKKSGLFENKSGDIQSKIDNFNFQDRNNSEKYEKMKNSTKDDVKQLLALDKEIEQNFNQQFKLTNKNEEMLTNKLSKLDSYTVLREKLFKEVGNEQLQKDIDDAWMQVKQSVEIGM